MGQIHPLLPPPPQGRPLYDVNTLVHGDVAHPLSWNRLEQQGANHISARRYAVANNQGSYDTYGLNQDRDAVGLGRRGTAVLIPDDCTAGDFILEAARDAAFPSGSKTRLLLLAADGTTVITSTVVQPNLTFDQYTLSATGLTGGAIYFPAIELNNSPTTTTQMVLYVRNVRFVPRYLSAPDGTKVFHAPFVRLPVLHETTHCNAETVNWPNSARTSALSEVHFERLGTKLAIEYDNHLTPSFDDIMALYAGDGSQGGLSIAPTGSSGDLRYAYVSGLAGQRERMRLVRGTTANTTPGLGTATFVGVWPRAIFLPLGSALIDPPIGVRRMAVYGDSRSVGGGGQGVVVPGFHSFVAQMRKEYPGEVIAIAHSGRSLAEDASTAAKRAALVELILRYGITDFMCNMGVNDALAAYWSASTFETVIGPLADDLRYVIAGRLVFIAPEQVVSPANDSLVAPFRTAIATEINARPWCTYVDPTSASPAWIPNAHLVADGIHEDAVGQTLKAQRALAVLNTAIAVASSVPASSSENFSGNMVGDGSGTEKKRFLANAGVGISPGTDNVSVDRPAYEATGPGGASRVYRNVRIAVRRNTMTTNHAIAVYKNGVEQSSMLQVVTPAQTGAFVISAGISCVVGDEIDIGCRGTTGGVGNEIALSLKIEVV